MRVGNVEVKRKGAELQVVVHNCANGYYLTFTHQVCGEYDAILRERDISEAMRRGRKELQGAVINDLAGRKLPGVRRGKLAAALAAVRQVYGL